MVSVYVVVYRPIVTLISCLPGVKIDLFNLLSRENSLKRELIKTFSGLCHSKSSLKTTIPLLNQMNDLQSFSVYLFESVNDETSFYTCKFMSEY